MILQLPETRADRLHLECVLNNGGSYVIDTRRCRAISVGDGVVKVVVTPLMKGGPGDDLLMQQSASFTVVK